MRNYKLNWCFYVIGRWFPLPITVNCLSELYCISQCEDIVHTEDVENDGQNFLSHCIKPACRIFCSGHIIFHIDKKPWRNLKPVADISKTEKIYAPCKHSPSYPIQIFLKDVISLPINPWVDRCKTEICLICDSDVWWFHRKEYHRNDWENYIHSPRVTLFMCEHVVLPECQNKGTNL